MDTNQPTARPAYVQKRTSNGLLGTGTPSAIAFAIGILLFLLPFSEIKCGGTVVASKTGIGYATGGKWNPAGGLGNKSFTGDSDSDKDFSKLDKTEEGNAKYFIWGALLLGVIGLVTSLAGKKMTSGGIVSGILGAGALIGFMVEVKRWFKNEMLKQAADKASEGADSLGLGDNVVFQLSMSPWYYVAVIAFIAGAVFCFLRMRGGARQ